MKFFSKKITLKQLRELICKFAKEKNVKKVIFNKQGKRVCGTYNATTNILYINLKQTKHKILCTFFHELAHHNAVQQKKWQNYHFNLKHISKNTIYKIENKIDRIGNKLWNKHVYLKQWGKYKYFYPKSEEKYF